MNVSGLLCSMLGMFGKLLVMHLGLLVGDLLPALQAPHFIVEPHLRFEVALLVLILLHREFIGRLLLVVLQDQRVGLVLQSDLLLLGCPLQNGQLLVQLLRKLHLLLLDLLVHLQRELPLSVLSNRMCVFHPLLQLLHQLLRALTKVLLQLPVKVCLLFVDGLRVGHTD